MGREPGRSAAKPSGPTGRASGSSGRGRKAEPHNTFLHMKVTSLGACPILPNTTCGHVLPAVHPPPPPAAEFVAARPHLRCVALLDASDPGFPSFPAVKSSTHLDLFGRMLPGELLNQGGDPFLYELYRSFGLAGVCAAITVHNAMGEKGVMGLAGEADAPCCDGRQVEL